MADAPLLALIPARAGSKGLPGKNLMPLGGVPLYRRALDQGLAAGARCLLSTDIAELTGADHGPGVQALARPAEIAGDDAPMDAVIAHALAQVPGPATVLLLQPTSPLRRAGDIAAALALHATGRFGLVMSVTAAPAQVLKYGTLSDGAFEPLRRAEYCFMNRQALPPVHRPDGAIYVFDADAFRARGTLAADRIGAVETPPERAIDIDSAADLARAEALLAGDVTPRRG